ncbi:DUF695 domain-containing protein [Actinoplanes sp. NPDC048988]|uniref:DUF695 domain-containing protein n=1 Tax=Actinoplanes sp. NPDC048988 TaxID=3363901 RepID=UPI003710AA17
MKLNPFRKEAKSEAEAIAAFWQWWAGTRDEVESAIDAGTVAELSRTIERRVRAIHRDLEWKVVPGMTSAHVLVVTPNWPDTIRAVAERWLAAAPPVDGTWSYRCEGVIADHAAFASTREFQGQMVDLSPVRFGVTVKEDARRSDVVCYHPAFVILPDDVQENLAYHAVELALGEDDTDIWIDEITWSAVEPAEALTPAELWRTVQTVAGSYDHWQHSRTEWNGQPVLVTVASPLVRARWPRFGLYVPVLLPYRNHDEDGLPADGSLEALRRFEGELSAALGADGALVAHTTVDRVRTLHFYVESQSGAAAELESRLPRWDEGSAAIAEVLLDPAFDRVEHLR